MLPAVWAVQAGDRALGHRTEDLVSHIWAIWNGTLGDPTRSRLASWPDGVDLLAIYGGWLHTFLGVALARAGLPLEQAYSLTLCLLLAGTGLGAMTLARVLGAAPAWAALAGVLLQLDGWILTNATQGRPEHADFGPTLFALAGAVASWRGQGPRITPFLTGLAGALVFVASWEQALWLFGATALLGLLLALQGPCAGSLKRWGLAGLTALVLSAPWVGSFLVRASRVRDLDEGRHTLVMAGDQGLLLGEWLLGVGENPSRLSLLCLLALGLVLRGGDRRLWAASLGFLGLSLVLAMGPEPGLWLRGDLGVTGPWAWLQVLPLLGWFHSPHRLAMGVHLVAPVAAALLACILWERGGRGRWLGPALALALLGTTAAETAKARLWPQAAFAIPDWDYLRQVGRVPGPGAVLELPPNATPTWAQDVQLRQLLHQRPVPGHAWLPHLATDHTPTALQTVPWLAWLAGLERGPEPELSLEHRSWLAARELRFLALDMRFLEPGQAARAEARLTDLVGGPVARMDRGWACWDLAPVLPELDP